VLNGNTVDIAGGTYISTVVGATDTVTVNHDTTTRTNTASSASPGVGGNFTAVDSVTTNSTGHVTGLNLKTVTLPDDGIDGSGTLNYVAKFTPDGDTIGNSQIFDNGTNVGIGTSSVDERLHVEGSVNNDDVAIKIENTFDDNNPSSAPTAALVFTAASTNGYMRVHGAPADTAAKHQIDIGSTASSSYLTFSPSTTEKMRITSSGNVGIGTTSPSQKLTLEDGQFHHTLSGNVMNKLYIGYNGVEYNGQFEMFQGATSKAYITANGNSYFNGGNVGINTTSPASKLDVNGGIRMADDSSTASASNVGTLRYRTSGNNSYVDMCMQTGASTYAWVNIVQNNW
jgi:hypothetical protein